MPGHAEIRESLAAYESLSRNEQIELNEHLVGCVECVQELTAYRRMDLALRHMSDPRPSGRLQDIFRVALAREQGHAQMAPPPRLRPSPVEPVHQQLRELKAASDATAESDDARSWRRALLPLAMVLLFVGSLWAGVRAEERPSRNRVAIVSTVTLSTDTAEKDPLQVPVAETPAAGHTQGPVTITFACDDSAELSGDYRTLAEQFEAENPDITVQLVTQQEALDGDQNRGGTRQSRIYLDRTRALALQTDVFCAHDDSDLIREGLVRNLMPLATAEPGFAIDEFYPAVLKQVTRSGALFLVPARFRPTLIRYDPAAFEAARIRPPRPGWSWNDLLSAASALTQRDGNNTRRWGFGESDNTLFRARFLSAVNSWKAATNAAERDPLVYGGVLDLFRWYNQLYLETKAAPIPRGLARAGAAQVSTQTFKTEAAQGRFAMWTDELGAIPPQGVRAAPFPVSRAFDKTTPIGTVDGWAISSGTQEVEAAWRWVSFISQHLPADRRRLRVPARRSVSQMQAFWSAVAEEDRDAYEYGLEHLATWPSLTQVDGTLQLYTSLLAMIRGETAPAEWIRRGKRGQ